MGSADPDSKGKGNRVVEIPVAQHLSNQAPPNRKMAVVLLVFKGNLKSSAFKNDHFKLKVKASCGLVRAE